MRGFHPRPGNSGLVLLRFGYITVLFYLCSRTVIKRLEARSRKCQRVGYACALSTRIEWDGWLSGCELRFRQSALRADLLRAQAQLDAAACDQLARRANHQKPVQPFAQKYSAFVLTQISRITAPVSRRMRGARDRHERADADGAIDVRAGSVRRSRVVRAPRCWR